MFEGRIITCRFTVTMIIIIELKVIAVITNSDDCYCRALLDVNKQTTL